MSYISSSLSSIINAVKKAGNALNRDFSEIEKLQSSVKSHKDFVLTSFKKIEGVLKTELAKVKPDYAFCQEGAEQPNAPHFIISALDGVVNFSHGMPCFAVSVAVFENNAISQSVVYSPVTDELYFAEKGKGAYREGFRNHERLRVSSRGDFVDSLICLKQDAKKPDCVSNIRILGCVSLSLAYVAAGRLDAVLSNDNTLGGIAAGLLLVKEAGGYVYEPNQKDFRSEDLPSIFESKNLVAINANMSKKVQDLLK